MLQSRTKRSRRRFDSEETDSLDSQSSTPAKRQRVCSQEEDRSERGGGSLFSRLYQTVRNLFRWSFRSHNVESQSPSCPPGTSVASTAPSHRFPHMDDKMTETDLPVQGPSPPTSASSPLPSTLPTNQLPPPPVRHSPLRPHYHFTSSQQTHTNEYTFSQPHVPTVHWPKTSILQGMERGYRDRHKSNHILSLRQPERTDSYTQPPPASTSTPRSPASTSTPRFYSLPRLPAILHPHSPTLVSPRSPPVSSPRSPTLLFPTQTPIPRTGSSSEGWREANSTPRGTVDLKKPSKVTPSCSRSHELHQVSQWLEDLSRDGAGSRRREEIEVAEKYLKLIQRDREKLEDARTERLRKQMDRIGLDSGVAEEEMDLSLTTEQHQKVSAALQRGRSEVVSERFRIQIKKCDIATLTGLEWLNDEVINFYFQLIAECSTQDTSNKDSKGRKVHVLSSFFYPKLVQAGYSGVRRWTRKVNLFEQDIVLLPIHLGMHWCLAAVDFSQKEIVYYDSLQGNNQSCLSRLKQYLVDESHDKLGAPIDVGPWRCRIPKDIPQQMNGSDCGVFTCMYARFVARGLEFTFSQEDMSKIRLHMICEILEQRLF